jgi:hypothetical protein
MLGIEDALRSADEVSAHIKSALSLYSNRPNQDYRNSIKESVSMCKKSTKSESPLPAVLTILDKNPKDHSNEKIYGYTSSAHAIRYRLPETREIGEEDAWFANCVFRIRKILKVKSQKADISGKVGRRSGQQPRKSM